MAEHVPDEKQETDQAAKFDELTLAANALREQAKEMMAPIAGEELDQSEVLAGLAEAAAADLIASSKEKLAPDEFRYRLQVYLAKFLLEQELELVKRGHAERITSGETLLKSAESLEGIAKTFEGDRRERLPDTRPGRVHKFSINNGMDIYLRVGVFENGRPGELFITAAKEGSTLGGLLNCIGVLISTGWQYGVPLCAMADKLKGTRFEPLGHSSNSEIGEVTSLIDYVFRWLEQEFPE